MVGLGSFTVLLNSFLSMHRRSKRAIFLIADCFLVPLSLYLAFALRYGTATPLASISSSAILFPLLTGIGILLIYLLRLDRIKLNAFEASAVSRFGLVAAVLAACAILSSYLLGLNGPRSVPLIFGIIFFFLSVALRLAALSFLHLLANMGGTQERVAIYGAGAAGIQLASALRQAQEARPMFFIDDNPSLNGLMISGLQVYGPGMLKTQLKKHEVSQILLAVPSIAKARRSELVEGLKELPVEVKVLPSYIELMSGNGLGDSFRPVSPDQLLGRDKVALDKPEIAKAYAGRVVMVTGAGGSIGSELCRQLLNCNPTRIIFLEQGEYQLYTIDQELRAEARRLGIEVTSRLGSVTNKSRIATVIADEGVDIILHAAAYKHVPLVEENELEGARNNVLGTQVVASAAAEAGIERFILVSTDKAVRPTNIMGATKRLAELVVQDIQTRSKVTKFAMVRFGNVLGSSGSVLPLFQQQIAKGGPLTVTHRDVTRFFMTIPEAARLVLLAGAYAEGGDVFVLDMGKPQKIIDIAHQMIELSGRKVKDPTTGVGDIAIEVTGLRPGEKLYEELLIDNESLIGTPHPKILRAEEAMLSQIEIAAILKELQRSIELGNPELLRELILSKVEGYHLQSKEALSS
jgi:FlaA1/EpsC-like NDP-sugar epimerase